MICVRKNSARPKRRKYVPGIGEDDAGDPSILASTCLLLASMPTTRSGAGDFASLTLFSGRMEIYSGRMEISCLGKGLRAAPLESRSESGPRSGSLQNHVVL